MILLQRRLKSMGNALAWLDNWEIIKRGLFTAAGLAILLGLYSGFLRVFRYLDGVAVIGPLLGWKLTAMAFLTTFSMIAVSSLIAAMTTLFYSYDLKFLFASPLSERKLFWDKAVETVFYSSWTIALALFPYILAFGKIKSAGMGFYLSFAALLVPFVMTAAAFGIIFSLFLMYIFPTSKTRDVVWILGSVSLAAVYVMVRFSQPEKLLRPDALEAVSQYLQYLQAPTAEYLPSWWITKAMMAFTAGKWAVFSAYGALLFVCCFAVYAFMIYIAGIFYAEGFSGAQEGRKFSSSGADCFERRLAAANYPFSRFLTLYWKDRKLFLRDARYWSQITLIIALISVYLFSIRQLPLDTPALKSVVSFLNIGIAGFVVAAIGLRFTFPAVSLEGKSYWLLKSAPLSVKQIMFEKLIFSAVPSIAIGSVLVIWSNRILNADLFVSALSAATIILCSAAISVMGVGLGAVFPRFNVENIHQIESSAGGFIYMACCLGYIGAVIAIEAWPVQMHFAGIFGRPGAWNWEIAGWCAAGFIVINAAAFFIPWTMGVRTLERHEI